MKCPSNSGDWTHFRCPVFKRVNKKKREREWRDQETAHPISNLRYKIDLSLSFWLHLFALADSYMSAFSPGCNLVLREGAISRPVNWSYFTNFLISSVILWCNISFSVSCASKIVDLIDSSLSTCWMEYQFPQVQSSFLCTEVSCFRLFSSAGILRISPFHVTSPYWASNWSIDLIYHSSRVHLQ